MYFFLFTFSISQINKLTIKVVNLLQSNIMSEIKLHCGPSSTVCSTKDLRYPMHSKLRSFDNKFSHLFGEITSAKSRGIDVH